MKKIKTWIILSILSCTSCTKALIDANESSSASVIFQQASDFVATRSAFLGIKKLNWDSISISNQAKIYEGMSDDSLYNVINTMLLTLKDGHTILYQKGRENIKTFDYTAGYPINFDKPLLMQYYWSNAKAIGPFTATIIQDIGYLYYPSFGDHITEAVMDEVFDFVQSTKGLIIDIRSNGGGDGTNSNTILSRFVTKSMLLGTNYIKKGPKPDDFFTTTYTLEPSNSPKKYLNKKIIVLSNRGEASASAYFVGYAKGLPNVISIGDTTGGAGGVGSSMQLGNGWQIVVSSTLGFDAVGNAIENGIPPTIKVDQIALDSLKHKDAILERALIEI
jgi:hypothetical protein